MDTEQSAPDSEASVTDRLGSFFQAEAEAPAEETPEAVQTAPETQSEAEPETKEETAEAVDDGLVEIEDEEGGKYRVSPKLRDERLRWKDYTEKTQEVAKVRAAAEDRMHYAEAREKIAEALSGEIGNLSALQAQRKQFDAIDFGALYRADPGQALALKDQRDTLDRQIAELGQTIQGKAQQAQQILKQHQAKQWELAVEGAKQRIGQYTPSDDAAMLAEVQKLGFEQGELQGRFADARFLHLVYKAAKWDALQSGKPSAIESATKAPPVVKPGVAKSPNTVAEQKYREARSALKKSGDLQSAARLFMLKG